MAMITACTNEQHLFIQSNKARPKDNSVLKECLESNHLPSALIQNVLPWHFRWRRFSAILFYSMPGGFPGGFLQSWLQRDTEESHCVLGPQSTIQNSSGKAASSASSIMNWTKYIPKCHSDLAKAPGARKQANNIAGLTGMSSLWSTRQNQN